VDAENPVQTDQHRVHRPRDAVFTEEDPDTNGGSADWNNDALQVYDARTHDLKLLSTSG
jgi:hypothetical protein